MTAPPNPAVKPALEAIAARDGRLRGLRVADLGRGKLRHYRILAPVARELFLIDTDVQLSSTHQDGDLIYTVDEFAERETRRGFRNVTALRDTQFQHSNLDLDLVFCIAVFDVVKKSARLSMIAAASRNLRRGGWFVVIIPRNDSSILTRCTPDKKNTDGYVFSHHGKYTFCRNFRNIRSLVRQGRRAGLRLAEDLSKYRQACLLFRKS